MPVVRITHEYTVGGELCLNTYHFHNASRLPDLTDVQELLADFESSMVPLINACQTTEADNVRLVGYAYNLGFSVEEGLIGGGTIDPATVNTIPPDIVLVAKRSVGLTFLNDGGTLYTGNRPIRQARFFLSGLPRNTMTVNGFTQGAYNAAFNALDSGQAMTLNTTGGGGFSWLHVVFGQELPALPPSPSFPSGKPMRPFVVAPVTGLVFRGFTNLSTRDL